MFLTRLVLLVRLWNLISHSPSLKIPVTKYVGVLPSGLPPQNLNHGAIVAYLADFMSLQVWIHVFT